MGVICGWLGESLSDPSVSIDTLLSTAVGFNPAHASMHSSTDCAVGICHPNPSLTPFISKELCAAIEGYPVWDDPALAHLASEHDSSFALAEGFRLFGPKVLEKVHGEFALCILKPADNYALLAVDRIGIRPLAYSTIRGSLIFGSQISSIVAHPAISPTIDPQAIFDYLYFQMIPSPGTIYRGVRKLRPAEFVEFSDGDLKTGSYWQTAFSEEKNAEQHLSSLLRTELRECVSDCLSEVPTGTFLSGGLDSSSVTGFYQQLSKEPIDAFAIGFNAEGFDEMEFARASANHFGANLHEYYVTPQDVLDSIPLIANSYDEPFGNASAIPAYFCAKMARETGKSLLLAGDGGDEIFAGNARYAKQKIFDLYRHVPDFLKGAFIEPAAFNIPFLRKLKSYIEQARIPMPDRMETYNFLHRSSLSEIFNRDFLDLVSTDAPLKYLSERYRTAAPDTSLIKRMLFLDHKFTLADNDLRKVNRMCELAGIEVRYPLLQERMMDFSAKVPTNMLLRGFELRSFYRRAMEGFLAKETLNKSKHGFGLPFGVWMNEYEPLRNFVDHNLTNFKKREIINVDYIEKIMDAQKTADASYYGVFIWLLVFLEQWMDANNL